MSVLAAHPIVGVDLRFTGAGWSFVAERRNEIAAFWAKKLAETPGLWEGEVLLVRGLELRGGGVLRGEMIRVPYSAYLAWRAWGRPESGVGQLLCIAMIRALDGALVFGVQADGTADAGAIKPPGGHLDVGDIQPDGRVDVFSAMARELTEETGLRVEDGTVAEDFAMRDGAMCSVVRVVAFPWPADEIASRIRDTLRLQSHPELADIVVIRGMQDLDAARVKPHWFQVASRIFARKGTL